MKVPDGCLKGIEGNKPTPKCPNGSYRLAVEPKLKTSWQRHALTHMQHLWRNVTKDARPAKWRVRCCWRHFGIGIQSARVLPQRRIRIDVVALRSGYCWSGQQAKPNREPDAGQSQPVSFGSKRCKHGLEDELPFEKLTPRSGAAWRRHSGRCTSRPAARATPRTPRSDRLAEQRDERFGRWRPVLQPPPATAIRGESGSIPALGWGINRRRARPGVQTPTVSKQGRCR